MKKKKVYCIVKYEHVKRDKMTKKERFKALIAEMKEIRDTTTDEYVEFILTYLIKRWS